MNKRIILVTFLFLTAIIGGYIFHNTNQLGKGTKEEVVQSYLQALAIKDEQAIHKLIPTDHQADKEVHDKVQQSGGHVIENPQTSYSGGDINPDFVVATIHGGYSDELNLQRINSRWFLILGRYTGKDAIPTNATTLHVDETANWKTYTNTKYRFSLQYPPDWVTVPYARPDIIPGFKPTNDKQYDAPYFAPFGITEGCNAGKPIGTYDQLKQWVNANGQAEVQGYTTINSSQTGVTTSGIQYYKVIWNLAPGSASKYSTYPVAYIELPGNINVLPDSTNYYCLEFEYGDPKYFSIIDKILSTFKFQ